MKGENIGLALVLAKACRLHGRAFVSTSSLAGITGFSQQSVSRKLREMESEGILSRKASNSGIEVAFTGNGKNELESLYRELKGVFGSKAKSAISGKVVDGMGEGRYYTSLPQYKMQFEKILGKKIFLGTLNLEINLEDLASFCSAPPIKVSGFSTKERTFGGIDCWECKINGKSEAIAILPHRTNHPKNVLEVVAAFNLRKKFGLQNGSKVRLVRP